MKNKLLFKVTLPKKIFILLAVGFIIVEYIHAQAMISSAFAKVQTNMRQECRESKINDLAATFYEKYDSIDNPEFLEEVKSLKNRQVLLNSQQGTFINKDIYTDESLFQTELAFVDTNKENYRVVLKNIDQEKKDYLEEVLTPGTYNFRAPMQFSVSFERVEKTHNGYYSESIKYLEINGLILIGTTIDKDAQIMFLEQYISPKYRINYSENERENWCLSEEVIRSTIMDNLSIHIENPMSILPVTDEAGRAKQIDNISENYFLEEDSLYLICSVPLISKNNVQSNGEIDVSDISGFLVYYALDIYSYSDIYDSIFLDNIRVYIIDFIIIVIISLIISYMLTKRVKEISTVTEKIANNDFDMRLNEKPDDELGVLSKNINIMSERLNNTIAKLNEEIENVKKLESVRKEFIANFTHEIKTPLGIIDGYIELIEVSTDDKKKENYFEEINKETKRINELVMAMLNLSRLESGKVELHPQDIDIEDMITSIVDSFTSLFQKKDIKVKLNGENAIIQADPFELEMVIKNFMSNAVKHTPQDGHIEIIYNQEQVSIENEGSLISEDKMKRIWDTYVSSDREGTGLGLAICKTILDLHGFKYQVENTEKGVRFTFTLKTPID